MIQTSVGAVAVLGGGFIGAWWQGRGQQRIEQERRRQQAAEVLAEITVLLEEIDAIRFFFKFTNEDWLKAVEPFVSRHESLRMQLLALTTSPQ